MEHDRLDRMCRLNPLKNRTVVEIIREKDMTIRRERLFNPPTKVHNIGDSENYNTPTP